MEHKLNTTLVIIGSILFHFLFWDEWAGLNILLFYLFILGASFACVRKDDLSKYAKYTIACTFLIAVSVVVNNSVISQIFFWLSFTVMLGFIHQKELSFFFYGIARYLKNIAGIPQVLTNSKVESETVAKKWKEALRFIKIAILPFLILIVFFFIYKSANPFLAKYSDQAFGWFSNIPFQDISFGSLFFFLVGFVVVGGALWVFPAGNLVKNNNSFTEILVRKRKRIIYESLPKSLDLKTEYRMAFLLMIMLNALLFLVNCLDLNFVWFNFEKVPDYPLKSFVHEGTYLLIFSIILASGIIIYYFRDNLNFYTKNKNLKLASYLWIAQNALLTLSVGVRNFRYVEYHGFAHLRVGVFIFLIAVIYGLYTVFKKVRDQRSFYYLLQKNSWFVFTLLVLTSLVNWDVVITRYNIAVETIKPLHITFLAKSSSDKNLFLLNQNTEEIIRQLPDGYTEGRLKELFVWKENSIRFKEKHGSWLSWNYADYRNIKQLNK